MLALNVRDHRLLDLAGPLWLDQSAPLGWLALERLAWFTLGAGERAMRLLPVLFGLGTLATCVWIGRRWMSPFGAFILALLCATGQWLVFFNLELKHYSADAFWALLLPALGAWSLEAHVDAAVARRRMVVWWMAAAIGSWLGNGATFVTPACAVVLIAESWHSRGARFARWPAALGCLWLASFALHYEIGLRHALDNHYLQQYWAFAFPPVAGGLRETLTWWLQLSEPFALKPAGSGGWVLFWIATITGFMFAIATRRPLGLLCVAVPLSAIALGVLRLVPPIERLGLWVVPSLYVGVALCGEAAVWFLRRPFAGWRGKLGFAGGAAAALIVCFVCVDIFTRGKVELEAKPLSNYRLDDRGSMRYLQALQEPGDLVLSTHFGLAGLWWYGNVNISPPDGGGRFNNGNAIFEVSHVPAGASCNRWNDEIDELFKRHDRVIVYLGFRMNVEPPGFDTLVLNELGRRGVLSAYREYAEDSRVVAFDLTRTPTEQIVIPTSRTETSHIAAPEGCVAITPARRW